MVCAHILHSLYLGQLLSHLKEERDAVTVCVIGWLRERTHRLLLSEGWGPTPPRLTIFFAFSHDPFRNSGSPETSKGPMVFVSFSSDVDCKTEAEVAAHSAAGKLEAGRQNSSLYSVKERLSRCTCFKRADSVILDHSTALRSRCFKEGDNRYEPMRNTDLWRSLLVHSRNSLYAVMASIHVHLMLGLYPDPNTIFYSSILLLNLKLKHSCALL